MKDHKRQLEKDLIEYINQKHSQDECVGFIDGYKKALKSVGIHIDPVIYKYGQEVRYRGYEYYVIEDNGEDEVLIATTTDPHNDSYDDRWVNRNEILRKVR